MKKYRSPEQVTVDLIKRYPEVCFATGSHDKEDLQVGENEYRYLFDISLLVLGCDPKQLDQCWSTIGKTLKTSDSARDEIKSHNADLVQSFEEYGVLFQQAA